MMWMYLITAIKDEMIVTANMFCSNTGVFRKHLQHFFSHSYRASMMITTIQYIPLWSFFSKFFFSSSWSRLNLANLLRPRCGIFLH